MNQSGSAIPMLYPVSVDNNGYVKSTDVTVQSDALNCTGITTQNINDLATGEILIGGKLENVTGFNFGDTIYVSKTGGLTNVLPDIGVGGFVVGDYVIRIGVIARNVLNPSNKDLILVLQLVGQL